jgi:hypothetical protein
MMGMMLHLTKLFIGLCTCKTFSTDSSDAFCNVKVVVDNAGLLANFGSCCPDTDGPNSQCRSVESAVSKYSKFSNSLEFQVKKCAFKPQVPNTTFAKLNQQLATAMGNDERDVALNVTKEIKRLQGQGAAQCVDARDYVMYALGLMRGSATKMYARSGGKGMPLAGQQLLETTSAEGILARYSTRLSRFTDEPDLTVPKVPTTSAPTPQWDGCSYENDGTCDVPMLCPKGTDKDDCASHALKEPPSTYTRKAACRKTTCTGGVDDSGFNSKPVVDRSPNDYPFDCGWTGQACACFCWVQQQTATSGSAAKLTPSHRAATAGAAAGQNLNLRGSASASTSSTTPDWLAPGGMVAPPQPPPLPPALPPAPLDNNVTPAP